MPSKQKSPRSEARRPVWAEVSLGALAHNLAAIRNYVNPPGEKRKAPRKILSIVKGNRSEEHTSELQSRGHLVCRLLLDPPTTDIYTLSLHDALPISAPLKAHAKQTEKSPQ